MLEKQIVVDLIETAENGSVQVRTCTRIIEDGQQISRAFAYHLISPGDDYSAEDAKVQSICAAVHTLEVIAAYKAAQLPQG